MGLKPGWAERISQNVQFGIFQMVQNWHSQTTCSVCILRVLLQISTAFVKTSNRSRQVMPLKSLVLFCRWLPLTPSHMWLSRDISSLTYVFCLIDIRRTGQRETSCALAASRCITSWCTVMLAWFSTPCQGCGWPLLDSGRGYWCYCCQQSIKREDSWHVAHNIQVNSEMLWTF